MAGKGDTPRPLSVPQETFASNYERIFSGNWMARRFRCRGCLDVFQVVVPVSPNLSGGFVAVEHECGSHADPEPEEAK